MEKALNHLKNLQDRCRRNLHNYAFDGANSIANYGKRLSCYLEMDGDSDVIDGYIISALDSVSKEAQRTIEKIELLKAEYESYRYAYDIIQDAMDREMR